MRLAELFQPAPREVRAAGVIAALPGLASVVFALVLLFDALSGTTTTAGGNSVYGQAAYYAILGIGLLACGVGLLLGYTWARSPAVVIALVMIGVGWYVGGPSGRPEWGVPIAVAAVALIVLLFRAPAREWALDDDASH
ncbi:MAG: hypothetical protein ACRDQB_05430 [Thermocrispum sp.]